MNKSEERDTIDSTLSGQLMGLVHALTFSCVDPVYFDNGESVEENGYKMRQGTFYRKVESGDERLRNRIALKKEELKTFYAGHILLENDLGKIAKGFVGSDRISTYHEITYLCADLKNLARVILHHQDEMKEYSFLVVPRFAEYTTQEEMFSYSVDFERVREDEKVVQYDFGRRRYETQVQLVERAPFNPQMSYGGFLREIGGIEKMAVIFRDFPGRVECNFDPGAGYRNTLGKVEHFLQHRFNLQVR